MEKCEAEDHLLFIRKIMERSTLHKAPLWGVHAHVGLAGLLASVAYRFLPVLSNQNLLSYWMVAAILVSLSSACLIKAS